MIPSFTSDTYPYLPIHVSVGDSYFFPDVEFDCEALLDTGFSGGLSVPPQHIPSTTAACGYVDGRAPPCVSPANAINP